MKEWLWQALYNWVLGYVFINKASNTCENFILYFNTASFFFNFHTIESRIGIDNYMGNAVYHKDNIRCKPNIISRFNEPRIERLFCSSHYSSLR